MFYYIITPSPVFTFKVDNCAMPPPPTICAVKSSSRALNNKPNLMLYIHRIALSTLGALHWLCVRRLRNCTRLLRNKSNICQRIIFLERTVAVTICFMSSPSVLWRHLNACPESAIQHQLKKFSITCDHFGMSISTMKTEAMYQAAPGKPYADTCIMINDQRR